MRIGVIIFIVLFVSACAREKRPVVKIKHTVKPIDDLVMSEIGAFLTDVENGLKPGIPMKRISGFDSNLTTVAGGKYTQNYKSTIANIAYETERFYAVSKGHFNTLESIRFSAHRVRDWNEISEQEIDLNHPYYISEITTYLGRPLIITEFNELIRIWDYQNTRITYREEGSSLVIYVRESIQPNKVELKRKV